MAKTKEPPKFVLLRDGTLLERKDDAYVVATSPGEVNQSLENLSLDIEVIPSKERLNMFVDKPVLDYFKSFGARWQTRINAVLRAYVQAQQQRKN